MKYSKEITAERIKILQRKHGLDQIEVAEKLYPGAERKSAQQKLNKRLSNTQKQRQEFSIEDLVSAANVFNVTIEWLLGEGPDDPEQAAAGIRDTSKGPSLRQIAEFFYDLTRINPGIAFGTVQRKELRLYNDNTSSAPDDVFDYTAAVFFPEYYQYDGIPDYAVKQVKTGGNHIPCAGQINRFLETLSRLTQLHEQGNLSPEELDTLILNRIAQLPDDPIEQIRPVAVQDPADPGAGK